MKLFVHVTIGNGVNEETYHSYLFAEHNGVWRDEIQAGATFEQDWDDARNELVAQMRKTNDGYNTDDIIKAVEKRGWKISSLDLPLVEVND